MKFCDFYSFEYAEIKNHTDVPLLKIESDYTIQSSGQLLTRLEAFAESIQPETLEQTIDGDTKGERKMGKGYFAGIDSGSTSTDVVILNKDHEIVTSIILPTGAGAAIGADRALAEALKEAGLQREDIDALVTTGYGRTAIKNGDKSITEITCHARGAHFLNPEVRTVIDIGGQDSKVIRLDENGAVANFVMNDNVRQEPDDFWNDGTYHGNESGSDERMWAGIQRRYYNFQYVYSICRIRSCIPDRPE